MYLRIPPSGIWHYRARWLRPEEPSGMVENRKATSLFQSFGQVLSIYLSISLSIYLSIIFLGPYLRHMEVPRLGVESELEVPAYTTATATLDPICICDLHCSLLQPWIFNLLSEARDQTCILRDTMSGS